MDYPALPPEINSARMYTGAGAAPLQTAALAWQRLAGDLDAAAVAYRSVISGLADAWHGPSSAAMARAAATYIAWLEASAAQCSRIGAQANAAAQAYQAALAATVPPPVIAANRAQLAALVATNLLGQNTPAIMETEAQYVEMWAQDVAAMARYQAQSLAATAPITPFAPAPQTTNPGAPAIQPAATTGGVESIESILEQLLNSLGLNPNGVPVLGLDGGTILGQYIEQSLGGGYPVNLAQLFVDFIGYTEVAAESQLIATAAASSGDGHGGGAPQTFSVSGATPYVSTHVTANMGGAGRLGRFSAPTWTTQPWNLEGRAPTVSVATPTTQRYQTGIPVPPAVPVTTAGRSAQRKIREDPEYGHVSKVVPTRHPSAG